MNIVRTARSGFSLLEIMIAISIIGIILGLVVPNAFRYFSAAERTKAEHGLRVLSDEIIQYKMHSGRYPMRLADLVVRPGDIKNWRGPYVEEENLIDPWGNEYAYEQRPAGSKPPFKVWSYGADGTATPESEWVTI